MLNHTKPTRQRDQAKPGGFVYVAQPGVCIFTAASLMEGSYQISIATTSRPVANHRCYHELC